MLSYKPKKLNQVGEINPLIIPLIISVVLFIAAMVAALKYYNDYTVQKDQNQPIIEKAVSDATSAQKKQLEAEFTEREKIPTRNYTSPSELGSVKLSFPKTWSSYVDNSSSKFDFFAYPSYVPSKGVNYALRMSITTEQFATALKTYDSQVQKGDLKATAVKGSGVTGTRLDGFLKKDQEGSMVVFPLRDKVLRIWTESKDYQADFNSIVLKNLTFVP